MQNKQLKECRCPGEVNCRARPTHNKGRIMKTMAQIAFISALVGVGAIAANAQTTNADLNVNVLLTATAQTAADVATKTKVTTKSILTELATLTGTSFSSHARLILRFPLTGDSPFFVVRDGTGSSAVDTDVSSFMGLEVCPSPYDAHVTTSTTRGSVTTQNEYQIILFSFNSGASPSFTVQGYTTSTSDDKASPGNTTPSKAAASVSGTGTNSNGNAAVLSGTITLSGRKIE